MTAIVYQSNTGFTERYAEMLSEKTGLPAYSLREAGKELQKGEPVIFMGWIRTGRVQGFKRAARSFDVRAVCAVGMGIPNEDSLAETRKRCKMETVFCLHGGLNMHLLTGLNRRMMEGFARSAVSMLAGTAAENENSANMLKMVTEGGDCVSEENLLPVIEWLDAQRGA